jgi:hypothetical protein
MAITAPAAFDPHIEALLTVRPQPTVEVNAKTGKSWPELEARGLPFRCGE